MTTSTADSKLVADTSSIGVKSDASHPHLKSSDKTPLALREPVSSSNLNICRNKHWRFISSYHGQWLQLPSEVLESLAHTNYFTTRPHYIDSAVFFDIARIRRLVDEATNLSVRANNGTTSLNFNASLNAGHDLHRGGSKLSGERKFRMRELAVKKLSEAYHLDEIAASVATMQSASSLEDVAKMVLQRVPNDVHARYVHFFHEKIPSRALSESTSLQPLDDILQESSMDCAALRTRAMTRVLKEDYAGAMRDLTEALENIRRDTAQHLKPASSVATHNDDVDSDHTICDAKYNTQKLANSQKPSGMEAQLHFQRAIVYLSLACQCVEEALSGNLPLENDLAEPTSKGVEATPCQSSLAYQKVKLNAKRALRDFTTFLSKLEYSSGNVAKSNGVALPDNPTSQFINDTLDDTQIPPNVNSPASEHATTTPVSKLLPRVYQVSDLFSPTPPTNLPLHPSMSRIPSDAELQKNPHQNQISHPKRSERVTYHPLLSEALHGLLLCHVLLQTDTTIIRKHVHMVARLISLSDGLPIFLAARSASRADWTSILSQVPDWLELDHAWDDLCRNNHHSKTSKLNSSASSRPESQSPSSTPPTTKQQLDLNAYSLGTDRAALIKRWIMEAPQLPDVPAKPRKGKKKGGRNTSLAQ